MARKIPFSFVIYAATLTASTETSSTVRIDQTSTLKRIRIGAYQGGSLALPRLLLRLRTGGNTLIFDDWVNAAALVGEQGQVNPYEFVGGGIELNDGETIIATYIAQGVDLSDVSISFEFDPLCGD